MRFGLSTDVQTSENLVNHDLPSIRATGEIVNCWATARVPLVAIEDIAQAALECIVSGQKSVKELIILEPQAITYDEVRRTHRASVVPA
jgi:uncharacterized protein YbjT (DUF2867 family)